MRYLSHVKTLLLIAMVTGSCLCCRVDASKTRALGGHKYCQVITNAINRGDWTSLRRLAKPGMRANEYIAMWENSKQSGHAVYVGKLVSVDTEAELNGKRCTKYSFALENQAGRPSPHELQIWVQEEGEESQLLDFANFGW